MIEFALQYSHTIEAQWREYCEAVDGGMLKTPEESAAATAAAKATPSKDKG
jgi:hypothetical protein